jgi:hypothetical protein
MLVDEVAESRRRRVEDAKRPRTGAPDSETHCGLMI